MIMNLYYSSLWMFYVCSCEKRKWWPIPEDVCHWALTVHWTHVCFFLASLTDFVTVFLETLFSTQSCAVIPSDHCSSKATGISLVDSRWSLNHVRSVCHGMTNSTALLFLFCIHTAHSKKHWIVLSNNKTEVCLFTGNWILTKLGGRWRGTEYHFIRAYSIQRLFLYL